MQAAWPFLHLSRVFIWYLFAPQWVVIGALCKQEVLQQPEKPNQTGAERKGHSLSHPQVRQRGIQHHLQQAGEQSGKWVKCGRKGKSGVVESDYLFWTSLKPHESGRAHCWPAFDIIRRANQLAGRAQFCENRKDLSPLSPHHILHPLHPTAAPQHGEDDVSQGVVELLLGGLLW